MIMDAKIFKELKYREKKKVLHKMVGVYITATCPTCNEVIFNENPYCPYCGQSLDWNVPEKVT